MIFPSDRFFPLSVCSGKKGGVKIGTFVSAGLVFPHGVFIDARRFVPGFAGLLFRIGFSVSITI